MHKYKSHNLIEVFFDFLKSPTLENGNIKSQYEKEAANWQNDPLVLRCPKCKSRDLSVLIMNKFKDIPEHKLRCFTCGWDQSEPFSSIMSFADISYPKSKWEEKYHKFFLKRQKQKEELE